MLKLLRRDLILNGRVLALTYAFWSLLWLGGPALSSAGNLTYGVWTGMVAVACAFLPITMLGREAKFRAGALACSLPVTRDAIVASRYVGGWVVALVGVALALGALAALSLAGVRPLVAPTSMLPIVAIITVGVGIALMMPLTIRFGIAGVVGFLVGLQLLGIVALLASALFDVRGVPLIAEAVRRAIRAGRSLHASWGPVLFSVVAVAAVSALNMASYRLSVWIYRRREF